MVNLVKSWMVFLIIIFHIWGGFLRSFNTRGHAAFKTDELVGKLIQHNDGSTKLKKLWKGGGDDTVNWVLGETKNETMEGDGNSLKEIGFDEEGVAEDEDMNLFSMSYLFGDEGGPDEEGGRVKEDDDEENDDGDEVLRTVLNEFAGITDDFTNRLMNDPNYYGNDE